jgi:hypothetical protein
MGTMVLVKISDKICRRSSGEYGGKEGEALCGNIVFWCGEIGVGREVEREGSARRLCDIVSLVPMRRSEKFNRACLGTDGLVSAKSLGAFEVLIEDDSTILTIGESVARTKNTRSPRFVAHH